MKDWTQLQLIVFDLDGTLIDSRHDIADSLNQALSELGYDTFTYDQLPAMLGDGLMALIRRATGVDDPDELTKIRKLYGQHYDTNYVNKTQLYPTVHDTLQQLSGTYQLAIYSNKTHYYTVQIAQALDIAPFCQVVQGAAPKLYPLKPHPAGLHRILDQLNVPAAHALMVGDSTHDLEAGQAANMATAAVTYGYRDGDTLATLKPDLMLHRMSDLLDAIR